VQKQGLTGIIFKGGGLRVDSKEAQGLFNKTATAEGVSSNLSRRIWIERFGPNLVRAVRSARRGSGRFDLVGLSGTAGQSPEFDSRGSARLGLAGAAQIRCSEGQNYSSSGLGWPTRHG
jgi:hypothetical protein